MNTGHLIFVYGTLKRGVELPCILGHEVSGTVVAVGSKVKQGSVVLVLENDQQLAKLEIGADARGGQDMAHVAAQAVADIGGGAGDAAQRQSQREPGRRAPVRSRPAARRAPVGRHRAGR